MKRSVKLLFIFTVLSFATLLTLSKLLHSKESFISSFPLNFLSVPSLKSTISDSLKDFKGKYALYIKNLKTGEEYQLNEGEIFEAGSLYKLWLMGAAFEEVKNGQLKMGDNLEADIEDINNKFKIDEEDAEFKEGHLQFSVGSAIEQMITISHNYAALLLLTKVPSDKVESFIKRHGLKSSTMELPLRTTAYDIASYFEYLYKGEIVDLESSKEMLEILKRQKINDRLPKNLPDGILVAHKTGDIGYFEHDGGVVFTPKGDYIIVVLTESDDPQKSGEKIATLSKTVYEYLTHYGF